MKFFLLATAFLAIQSVSFSQTNEEKAGQMTYDAVQKMDAGDPKGAIELLKKAKKLDPKSMDIPYEMGYAYLLMEDYKKAVESFESILKHKDVTERVYVMLGNSYDYNGQPDLAIQTYDKGLKKFPKAGALYLERGNMHLQAGEYNEAMSYYEKGIDADPQYSSNYYRASKIYFMSNQKIWGMMYAEIFILLQPGTDRSMELSALLYDCYHDNIEITSDTSIQVDFCENIISINKASDLKNFLMPYCTSWGSAMALATAIDFDDSLNLAGLVKIRSNFISNYYSLGTDKNFPNALYDYCKQVQDAGHADAYNYYILMMGDPDSAKIWLDSNEVALDNLSEYMAKNPFKVSENNHFVRTQYPGEY